MISYYILVNILWAMATIIKSFNTQVDSYLRPFKTIKIEKSPKESEWLIPGSNVGSNVVFSNKAQLFLHYCKFQPYPHSPHTSHMPYTLSYFILYFFCSMLFNVFYYVCKYCINRNIFNFLFSMLECEKHECKYYWLCLLMYPRDLE